MVKVIKKLIKDPAAWYGDQIVEDKSWTYTLSDSEVIEINLAIKKTKHIPVRQIKKVDFPLPMLSQKLFKISEMVDKGLGVAMIRGLPVQSMKRNNSTRALWGMGQHIGIPQPQDAKQHLLHKVRDTGRQILKDPNLRIYQTNAEQSFHNDGGDLVMLLCIKQAKSGGTSRMVSALTVFNEVLKYNEKYAIALQEDFYFDARGQQRPGCSAIQKVPIYIWHSGRLNSLYKRPYINLAQRFCDVPRLSQLQVEALDMVDTLCNNPKIHLTFDMEPGDIQVVSNFSIFHARDSFEDQKKKEEKRHMLRLWLGLPRGRKLPKEYLRTREFGPLFDLPGRY